jgi:hypothetical protein
VFSKFLSFYNKKKLSLSNGNRIKEGKKKFKKKVKGLLDISFFVFLNQQSPPKKSSHP